MDGSPGEVKYRAPYGANNVPSQRTKHLLGESCDVLEKLGLANFDTRKCCVLLILIYKNIPGAKCPRCQFVHFYPLCQIVRGVKLFVCTHHVKFSAVSNCPRCGFVCAVELTSVSSCPLSAVF